MLSLTHRLFGIALLLTTVMTASAQPVTLPRNPSPAAQIGQTIGISTITVSYSRPSVKGRQIWGGVVPYGWNKQAFGPGKDAPWRAGANENTVLTLSHDAMVEGQAVPAGSYGLFLVVNKDNTGQLILSKDYKSWGSFFYNPALDQMRAPVRLHDGPMAELLTYSFDQIDRSSAELVLAWEKKTIPIKISFAVDSIVVSNARQELRNMPGFTPQGYLSIANYCLQNKVNFDEALGWVEKAIAQNKTFTALHIKSGLLKASGKEAEANAVMKDAAMVANEFELNQYGYQLLGSGDVNSAIPIFILSTKKNPASPNAWDSLGEAYVAAGDKKNAIASFKKSLSMNPPENVRLNSEKFLQQLGAK